MNSGASCPSELTRAQTQPARAIPQRLGQEADEPRRGGDEHEQHPPRVFFRAARSAPAPPRSVVPGEKGQVAQQADEGGQRDIGQDVAVIGHARWIGDGPNRAQAEVGQVDEPHRVDRLEEVQRPLVPLEPERDDPAQPHAQHHRVEPGVLNQGDRGSHTGNQDEEQRRSEEIVPAAQAGHCLVDLGHTNPARPDKVIRPISGPASPITRGGRRPAQNAACGLRVADCAG